MTTDEAWKRFFENPHDREAIDVLEAAADAMGKQQRDAMEEEAMGMGEGTEQADTPLPRVLNAYPPYHNKTPKP